jgi:ferredoxin/flavodoxin---NADP+ reductase
MTDDSAAHPRSIASKEIIAILREASSQPRRKFHRQLRLVFRSSAQKIHAQGGSLHVALATDSASGSAVQSLRFDTVISATGFELAGDHHHSLPLAAGALSNRAGQLIDLQGRLVPRLYAVGWAARGATGTIGTCRSDAERLVMTLLTDARVTAQREVAGRVGLMATLKNRAHPVTNFQQWLHIDGLERENGASMGRSRLKMPTAAQLLQTMNCRTPPDRFDPCPIKTPGPRDS